MNVQWSLRAQSDLADIRAYIGVDSVVNAGRMIDRILDAVELMRDFPESGGMLVEDERSDLRQVFVARYRVIYRIEVDRLLILSVLHGARHSSDHFD